MRIVSLLFVLLLLTAPLAWADEPAAAPEPPAGSIKLKTPEPEPEELPDQGPVTGKVQKPSVDVLILSDPVKPEIEPPKRRDR